MRLFCVNTIPTYFYRQTWLHLCNPWVIWCLCRHLFQGKRVVIIKPNEFIWAFAVSEPDAYACAWIFASRCMIWYMIWHGMARHDMAWHGDMIYDMIWYMLCYAMIGHGMVWHNMTWHDIWHDTWHDMIYGMTWYMSWHDIWHDMIYDMIWYIWYMNVCIINPDFTGIFIEMYTFYFAWYRYFIFTLH